MIEIMKYWGLTNEMVVQIDTIHKSTWNIGDEYILKYNSNKRELSHSIKLANLLSSYDIPIASYIKTIDDEWTTPDGTYCLMKKIRGNHIDFYSHPDMIKVFGQELAKLHIALLHIEKEIEYRDSNFISEWQDFIKPGLVNVSNEMIDFIENKFLNLYENLPKQLIHRDVHSQNVLFDNGKVSGWLDFDLNCRNTRIFDLAYLLGGLLHGETNNIARIEIWETLYQDLLVGYDSVNYISDDQKEALPFMMIAIELLFVTFWNNRGNIEETDAAVILAEWLYKNYGKK